MKVSIELENLENNIQEILSTNINDVIKQEVYGMAKTEVNNQVKDVIKEQIGLHLKDYVESYIKTTTIKIGGGFYSNEPEKELTVEEFLKNEIKECMESKKLISYDRNRNKVETTFEDYIKKEFDITDNVRGQLSRFMSDVENDINKRLKQQFDEVTKQVLSDTVLTLLSQNETFTKIQNNIVGIASRD